MIEKDKRYTTGYCSTVGCESGFGVVNIITGRCLRCEGKEGEPVKFETEVQWSAGPMDDWRSYVNCDHKSLPHPCRTCVSRQVDQIPVELRREADCSGCWYEAHHLLDDLWMHEETCRKTLREKLGAAECLERITRYVQEDDVEDRDDGKCQDGDDCQGEDADVLRAGDVVELMSGGPKMTVQWVNAEGDVGCKWFPARDQLPAVELFKTAGLRKVS